MVEIDFYNRGATVPRLRADAPLDIVGFYDMIISLWQEIGNKERVMKYCDMSKWEDYPCVTIRTISSILPTDQRERRPRPRQTITDSHKPDEFIEMLGQIREYIVEFKVYGRTPDEADELHKKFEDFLVLYTPYFTQKGAKNIYFYRQLEDGLIADWHNPVITRTFQYQVRLERVTINRMAELTNVRINIQHPLV